MSKPPRDMSQPSIRPKATSIWSEQTEKLRQKFINFTDRNLVFEQDKLEEMLSRNQREEGTNIFFMR